MNCANKKQTESASIQGRENSNATLFSQMVMSDPNDDDLYQIEIDLDTKKWRPANVSLNFSDEDELEVPEDLISNNSLPSDRRLLEASDLTTVDRYVPQHLPREGFMYIQSLIREYNHSM